MKSVLLTWPILLLTALLMHAGAAMAISKPQTSATPGGDDVVELASRIAMVPSSDGTSATARHDEEAIRQADEAERRAMLHVDTERLVQLWGQDFIVTSALGDVLTKEEILEIFAEGAVPYSSFERDVENVRLYGDVAVSIGSEVTVSRAGPQRDEPISRRYTHVWVKRDGTWQLVSRHASEL